MIAVWTKDTDWWYKQTKEVQGAIEKWFGTALQDGSLEKFTDETFAKADVDKDGKLQFDEFKVYM